jgi:lysophospholipase L1-like esterase
LKRLRRFVPGVILVVVTALTAGALPGPAQAASPKAGVSSVLAGGAAALGHLGVVKLAVPPTHPGPTPDETVELDPGAGFDPAIALQVVVEAQAQNPRLSDTIKQTIDTHPLAGAPDTQNWVDFDGTLAATPTGISITIPGSEVQNTASWYQNAGISTLAYLGGLVLRALCVGGLKVYLPALSLVAVKTICASVSAFAVTLVRGVWLQYIDGTLGDAGAWATTLGSALLTAASAAIWESGLNKWAEDKLPLYIRTLTAWIRGTVLPGWLGWLNNTRAAVGDYLDNIANALPGIVRRLPGPTSTPLRVMVVGDSMSQGREGDWTWRYRLWQWFQSEGIAVDFVGPYTGTKSPDKPAPPAAPALQGSTPPAPGLPDTSGGYAAGAPTFNSNHFAVWGRQAAQDKYLIRQEVATYHPDLLLVGLGFNDLGWFVSGPQGSLDSMKTLVDQARAANPAIAFALANVPQRTSLGAANPDLPAKTDVYNTLLLGTIPSWSTPASPVALVDWRGNYSCETTGCPAGYDGLHPNALGEYQIAHAYELALHNSYGLGYDVPAVPTDTPTRPTPVPSNVTAASSPYGVTVTWDAVYGAIGYTVRSRIVGTTAWTESSVGANGFYTTWTVDGQQWEYQVRTDNGDQLKSGWSATVSATAHPQTAPPPVGITTHATATGVDVAWGAPTGPYTNTIDLYQVITYDKDTLGAYIGGTAVTGLSAHVDGLVPGHHYIIAVVTWNAAGGGMPGIARPVTIGTGTPPAPTGLQVTTIDPATVQLTWTGSSQAAGYRVWARNINNGSQFTTDENIVGGTSTGIAFLFPGVWNYEFCVTAINGAAESAKSNCVVAPVPAPPVAPPPPTSTPVPPAPTPSPASAQLTLTP